MLPPHQRSIDVTDDKKEDKKAAQIFRKPIHEKATRKVSALPRLLKQSQRPDGEKATRVEEEESSPQTDDKKGPTSEESPSDEEANFDIDVEIDDGGLFDDLFDED